MATKKKEKPVEVEQKQEKAVQKYKGSQLLKLPAYNSRVARVVIKENESYSLEEADKLIEKYMKKEG